MDLTNNPGMSSVPSAPPPPPEVKVRTMRSDLEAMAKSGGGLPHFQSVKVEGLGGGQKNAGAPPTPAPFFNATVRGGVPSSPISVQSTSVEKGKKASAITALIAALILALLGSVGYFVYQTFFPATPPMPSAPAVSGNPSSSGGNGSSTSGGAPAVALPASFTHTSSFKKPADQTFILPFANGNAATNATDLETFNQKLSKLLASANKNAMFVEIVPQHADGSGVNIEDLLSAENASILDPQYLLAHFSPDATMFAYRDKNGWWPGYVIPLLPSENWLFLKNDVGKLESSPDLANLFLLNIGAPAKGGFADSNVSSTPVRVLSFPGGTTPTGPTASATFIYGWYQSYLVISTSPAGFSEALGRL